MNYTPQHERVRPQSYYTTRTIVRGIFWTTTVLISAAVSIAVIWILWAVS